MKTRSIIVLAAEVRDEEESWIEEWLGYGPDLTEEEAAEEVFDTMIAFNRTLRPYEKERVAFSFVLTPVREDKNLP